MRKNSRIISSLLLGTVIATMSMSAFAVEANRRDRGYLLLAGKDRYETAVKVNRIFDRFVDTIVLVNAHSLPDALAAAPLAAQYGASILLTEKDNLTDVTRAEIERMEVRNVIIVGGEGVVSEEVVKTLEEMNVHIERVSGVNRIETALEVAKRIDAREIAVVNGREGLADALSVAAPAGRAGMAIILSEKDDLGSSEEYIKNSEIEKAYVIGGEGVISKEVEEKLPNVERLAGADRNETNAAVINRFYENERLDAICLAKDGKNSISELIDALAIAPKAARGNVPVLLVGNELSQGQADFLTDKQIGEPTKVGYGISDNVSAQVAAIIGINNIDMPIDMVREAMAEDNQDMEYNKDKQGNKLNDEYNEIDMNTLAR